MDSNGKDSNTIQQSLYGRFLGGKGREEVQSLISGEGLCVPCLFKGMYHMHTGKNVSAALVRWISSVARSQTHLLFSGGRLLSTIIYLSLKGRLYYWIIYWTFFLIEEVELDL